MADAKITVLGVGTPKATDVFVAVDTTDNSMAPTGTDKKYTASDIASFITSSITLAGDVTGSPTSNTIGANAVTNAKLANMPAHTFKGNNGESSGDPEDLTIAEMKTELDLGTMSEQNADFVIITGGTLNGVTIGAVDPDAITALTMKITTFTTNGVVHNNTLGELSSSLVVNADMANMANNTFKGNVSGGAAAPSDLSTAQMQTALGYITHLTGDVTATGPGSVAATIANSAVTNAKMANMANNTFKGNISGGSAAPSDLTVSQMQTALGITGSVTISNTQIGFGNSSNNLIGSADLTWNDSTKVLTANGSGSVQSNFRVGGTSGSPYITLGNDSTTSGPIFARPTTANAYFTGTTSGDAVIRNADTSKKIFIGVATSGNPAQINISNTAITTTVGITLPTTGGTAAVLSDYEIYTTTLNMTGPIAGTVPLDIRLVRNGDIVTITWGVVNGTRTVANKQLFSNAALPARFNPGYAVRPRQAAWVIDGSSTTSYVIGGVFIAITGELFFESANLGNFTGSTFGVIGGAFTYNL